MKMKIPNISKTEMKMEIDFKEMIKFLEKELEISVVIQEDPTSFQGFLRLEKFLEMRGPFTIYEEKQKQWLG